MADNDSLIAERGCVLFDFDGTLADTPPAIMKAARVVLLEWGMDPERVTDEALTRLVGPPFPKAFQVAFGLSLEDAEEVTARYREVTNGGMLENHELYPGIRELLRNLRSAGKRLAIVTSRRQWQARKMAEKDGILGYFEVVVGQLGDEALAKPVLVGRALDELGVTGNDAVMVGDRALDIEGARANGMPSIGCLFGTAPLSELEEAGATVIVEDVPALAAVLLNTPD